MKDGAAKQVTGGSALDRIAVINARLKNEGLEPLSPNEKDDALKLLKEGKNIDEVVKEIKRCRNKNQLPVAPKKDK